jgi:NAD(P)H-nitrite reductase large subunit
MKDLYEIKEYAKGKKTAAVIGGGVLGLEAASELNLLGLDVTVLERNDRILSKQLDNNGSIILEDIVKETGVTIRKFASSKEIAGDEKVTGVLLEDGETIPADLIIISTGVKSNCEIAFPDIEIKRSIVVNNMMETNIPDVYACGDCAEFDGVNYALWSEAILQGKAAGVNAVGDKFIYEQIVPSTTLNAFNSSVFSIGDIGLKKDVNYEVYELMERDRKNYVKMYFANGILTGGILIGDTSKTVDLIEGFEKSKSKDEMIKNFN